VSCYQLCVYYAGIRVESFMWPWKVWGGNFFHYLEFCIKMLKYKLSWKYTFQIFHILIEITASLQVSYTVNGKDTQIIEKKTDNPGFMCNQETMIIFECRVLEMCALHLIHSIIQQNCKIGKCTELLVHILFRSICMFHYLASYASDTCMNMWRLKQCDSFNNIL
jgi:hypothetical protein